jgi:phosphoribosyl 1,2-cyclic phosphodiesterase
MSLLVTSLNSGSNGNCYYIGNENEAILVDAGISCRETEKRMKRLDLSMQKVKAIFISHEHADHIFGIRVLATKYRLPVYCTPTIMQHARISIDQSLVYHYSSCLPVSIGNLTITAFPKLHDASDPYSFIIGCNGVYVGVFTDIGKPCDHVIKYFKLCHAAFLECNYDEHMLQSGRYPYHLKRRIQSEKGHLSNMQALELFTAHRPAFMSHLFLSHLSKENNCPDLAQQLFNDHASGTEIILASRFRETPIYRIRTNEPQKMHVNRSLSRPKQLQFSFS